MADVGSKRAERCVTHHICDCQGEELERLRAEIAEVKTGYDALDKNWDAMHSMAMGAFAKALNMPGKTVPEMCAAIKQLMDAWVLQAIREGRVEDDR